MNCDVPPPAPAPGILADMLARRAWDDDINDSDRLLMEWAADTIRFINTDRFASKRNAEHFEAEAQTYANILYGPNQKGGSA